MQTQIHRPCGGAPLVLTSVSVELSSNNNNLCYAVQVEAVIIGAAVEFLSCTHHKKKKERKFFIFPGATHGQSGALLWRLGVMC